MTAKEFKALYRCDEKTIARTNQVSRDFASQPKEESE